MGGEITIVDCGKRVWLESYRINGQSVMEMRIEGLPIIIMSEQQAYNIKSALNKMFPSCVSCNECGDTNAN